MTDIEIAGPDLLVRVEGLDRLFAFKNELRVPLRHVAGVETATDEARSWFHGLRVGGTNIPV